MKIYYFQLFPDDLSIGFFFPYNFEYIEDIAYFKAILIQLACLKLKECGIKFLAKNYGEILETLVKLEDLNK